MAHIVDAWQVLESKQQLGASVVITDLRSAWIGIGLAEKLITEGHRVRYFTSGPMIGQSLRSYLRDQWVGKLHELGVQMTTYARLGGVDATMAYFQHTSNGTVTEVEDVNTVVFSLGHQREATLEPGLRELDIELRVIGDCVTPRTAEEAVFDWLQAGTEV